VPRETLSQAIDYASNVAEWTAEKLSDVNSSYTSKAFGESFNKAFYDVDLENANLK